MKSASSLPRIEREAILRDTKGRTWALERILSTGYNEAEGGRFFEVRMTTGVFRIASEELALYYEFESKTPEKGERFERNLGAY